MYILGGRKEGISREDETIGEHEKGNCAKWRNWKTKHGIKIIKVVGKKVIMGKRISRVDSTRQKHEEEKFGNMEGMENKARNEK